MVVTVHLRAAVAFAGRYPLLAGADFDARAGEIVVVKGPNGAGKTSLLRVLAGLLPLAAGEASVLGLDPMVDARALRPLVGIVGHRTGLYDDLTAGENVRFAVRAARLPKQAAADALERLGFGERLLRVPAGRLSAGQRRRVALAALLARRPRLWLLDEPHAGLDAQHRQLLDDLLREVAGAGATVVFASHEERTADALAHRAVVMSGGVVNGGVLLGTGPPDPRLQAVGEATAEVVAAAAAGGANGPPASRPEVPSVA
ncbi:MAG: heme ABC exporter ATP-binding protein CcmA [Acidimicrobiales bacterium]